MDRLANGDESRKVQHRCPSEYQAAESPKLDRPVSVRHHGLVRITRTRTGKEAPGQGLGIRNKGYAMS
jgi:hypothetical protein